MKSRVHALSLVILVALTGRCIASNSNRPDLISRVDDAKAIEFFEKEVRPLLIKHCYACHSAEGKQRAGLRLDTKTGWELGGDSGPALKPGNPDHSRLITAGRYDDESLQMPPIGKLTSGEIETLVRWVKLGAPDPRTGDAAPVPARYGMDIETGRKFWSFRLPAKPAIPPVTDTSWPRSDIDRFIRARQEAKGVKPVGDAERRTLLRRAYFDLIGLPPTPEQSDAFVNDSSPDAFAKVVDGLLASPHFGERWGRHWLDVARFADTSGAANNQFLPDAWRYRDYIIRAFNRDKPYDRFLTEQLAGDLLPAANAEQRDDQIVATGFLALGIHDTEKLDAQVRMDQIDEQIDVTTRAMLATTVACARCHDHKFDPIPATDYYALAGIFGSTEILKSAVYTKGKHNLVRVTMGAPLQGYRQEPVDEFTKLQEQLYAGRGDVVRGTWDVNKLEATARGTKDPAERERLLAQVAAQRKDFANRIAGSKEAASKLETFPPLPPMALAVRDADKVGDLPLLIRGDVENKGPVVPRGFLQVMTHATPPALDPKQSGRLELARWIASRDNPLTARVLVNRTWQHLFGTGLVRTSDNFGFNGEKPSHPELLDHLAVTFMDDGWSVKKLIRRIMLSRTYQLSPAASAEAAETDADNRLLWRANRRRMEAEIIRDSVLAFSGQLDPTPREKSLIHELGVGTMRFDADRVVFDSNKRSLYLPQPRARIPEILALFDMADNKIVVAQREVTTVPLQSLFMLNSPFILDQSRAAAERLKAIEGLDDAARVNHAFRLALGRPATAEEQIVARRFFDTYEKAANAPSIATTRPPGSKPPAGKARRKQVGKSQSPPQNTGARPDAWAAFCQILIASPEFRYVD